MKAIPLFAGLNAEQLLPIAEIAVTRQFTAGETIFEEGSVGDELYLITAGQVEILRGAKTVASLGVGECFGEMALLDRSPRSATARAALDTTVLATPQEDFQELLNLYPMLARQIAEVLGQRLRAATEAL